LKKLFLLLLLAALYAVPNSAFAVPDDPTARASNRAIGDEEIEPKDPALATVFSVLPGIVFHGSGNYYAGDYEWGNKMLVMEIIGGGIAIWGHSLIHESSNWDPYFGSDQNSQQAGYWIKAGGVAMIFASWVGDVATASDAADSWNKDHQMQFQMDSYNGTGVRMALGTSF
jgi:hypothetical protein